MGRSIERIAVGSFVFAISILTIVGLMAIWNWIDTDILWKSFSTIGVLGVAALVVVGITRVSNKYYQGVPAVPVQETAAWKSARNLLLGIVGAVFLFFAGMTILSIWNFIGGDVTEKALESMLLLFIASVALMVAFKSQME